MQTITDEELDAYILTRLRLLGIDLSVLPWDDKDAPADQKRILGSARRFLRSSPPSIAETELSPAVDTPMLYPSGLIDFLKGTE